MNKINFTFISEYAYNIDAAWPRPSTEFVPEWFRDMSPYDDNSNEFNVSQRHSNASFKKCTPILDAIISGYTFSLWSDIFVSEQDSLPYLNWKVSREVFAPHGPSSRNIPPPPGYENIVFKYNSMVTAQTPQGYSLFVTSPPGHYDLPFLAIPAIIDADIRTIDLSFPMWIKKDFRGIVEKGTPLVQVTPFKRESWKAEFDYMTDLQFTTHMDNNFYSKIKNHYIKNIWSKKVYK